MKEEVKQLYISDPTWGLEEACFLFGSDGNIKQGLYPWWDGENKTVMVDALLKHMNEVPERSFYVLQPCGHNPTGMDPSREEWERILEVVKAKNHLIMLDSAYQGFASGDLIEDRFVMELFYNSGIEFIASQSFSKSLGLYGERVGMVHFICES